jgi:hypothetical protein
MLEQIRRFLLELFLPWRQHGQALPKHTLDYDQLIHLDAEDLAEGGVPQAYANLLPVLRTYFAQPIAQVELADEADGTQVVLAGGRRYVIWPKNSERGDGWVRAPIALFDIVNRNLLQTDVRFYALYSDNDLSGMFLTATQVAAARLALKNRSDWPYLLVDEPPSYGHPSATSSSSA